MDINIPEYLIKEIQKISDNKYKNLENMSDYGDEEEKNSTANKIGNTIKFSNDNKKEETNDLNNKNIEEKNNNNFNNIKYLIGDDN